VINRNAIIIRFKKPFLNWIETTGDAFEPSGSDDYNIYLVPEIEGEEELEDILQKHWATIFDEELYNWCTDDSLWPSGRSYEMFKDWVSVEDFSVIHDLGDDEIIESDFKPNYTSQETQTNQIFSKVVSGGQTGADQGALDAALALGHPCGGWCPKGRKSESGRIPDKYPLKEHTSASYPARTEANVKDSDGTLIFTYGEPTGGTALTVDLAKKHNKPVYIFDFNRDAINPDPAEIFEWGAENNVYTLNVAGPRESKKPGTQDLVESVMVQVLEFARGAYPVVA
jgi:hypothetical protein